MATIAFIGLGNMGGPMAANLVKGGIKLLAFDLLPAHLEEAKANGLSIAASAAEAVADVDAVITMLPAGNMFFPFMKTSRLKPEKIQFSSIVRQLMLISARKAHEIAAKHGHLSVDAPVSGGTGGAAAGTLTFMAGGREGAFDKAEPILKPMAGKIVHCGGDGAGQAAKICNNMILGISMIGVSEAFCSGGKTRPFPSGVIRRGLNFVRSVLVADNLLPGTRPSANLASQS
jgi:3-hydroxyisobutyrate dehydrogenase